LTLVSWYRGVGLVRDATVVETFTWGHYKGTARQAGFAATKCQNTMTSKAITTFNQL